MKTYAVSVTLVRQNTVTSISVANFLDSIEAATRELAIAIGVARATRLRPDHEIVSRQAIEIVTGPTILVL